MTGSITLLKGPHTAFFSKDDLEEFGDEAIEIERAIAAYRKTAAKPHYGKNCAPLDGRTMRSKQS